MNIFILVNEDNDEPIENGSSEGLPDGETGADQEGQGENTEVETGQEQENDVSENTRANDSQQVELVDYSESLEEMNERLEEIASYSFASVLILAQILLIKLIQWIFSGFR